MYTRELVIPLSIEIQRELIFITIYEIKYYTKIIWNFLKNNTIKLYTSKERKGKTNHKDYLINGLEENQFSRL